MLETSHIDDVFKGAAEGPSYGRVRVKKRGQVSTVTYPYNPLDAVGWHGDLAPVSINVKRPEAGGNPSLSPAAQRPHDVLEATALSSAPSARARSRPTRVRCKVPFFHNNDDFDEVLFYHAGDFFSRDNIKAGMMTFHPSGFTHGPHPKALNKMLEQDKPMTDEYAVMIDTRDPLGRRRAGFAVENAAYVDSWQPKGASRLRT